jgi:hypothetical protein
MITQHSSLHIQNNLLTWTAQEIYALSMPTLPIHPTLEVPLDTWLHTLELLIPSAAILLCLRASFCLRTVPTQHILDAAHSLPDALPFDTGRTASSWLCHSALSSSQSLSIDDVNLLKWAAGNMLRGRLVLSLHLCIYCFYPAKGPPSPTHCTCGRKA